MILSISSNKIFVKTVFIHFLGKPHGFKVSPVDHTELGQKSRIMLLRFERDIFHQLVIQEVKFFVIDFIESSGYQLLSLVVDIRIHDGQFEGLIDEGDSGLIYYSGGCLCSSVGVVASVDMIFWDFDNLMVAFFGSDLVHLVISFQVRMVRHYL